MAYNKKQIKSELINNIETIEDITSFDDAALTVAPTRKTLYDWEFHKCDALKGLIDRNKIKVKQNLRKQWKAEGASPTLQLALYKLLSTDEELQALSMEYKRHSGEIGVRKIQRTIVDPKDE